MEKTALFKKGFLAAIAALIMLPASADYNKFGIPDSAEIRRVVKDTWLTPTLGELRNKHIESRENATGTLFQIRLEESADDFKVIIAPQSQLNVDMISDTNKKTVKMDVYPEGAPGSWVLYRNKTTGKPTKICWYFNADADVYIQLRPQGTKTFADLIVFGAYAARSVPTGVPFERFYTTSFAEVYKMTERTLPWQKVTVVPKQYHSSLQMANVIRKYIPRIDYAEDAAYNESGKLYSITTGEPLKIIGEDDGVSYQDVVDNFDSDKNEVLPEGDAADTVATDGESEASAAVPDNTKPKKRLTLSGAGFVKWIVDGLIEPATGSATKISDLVQETVTYNPLDKNGVISQKYNLSFTLDWTRNLAAKAVSARSSRVFDFRTGGVDVTVEPFAAEVANGKMVNTTGYIKDTGYSPKVLKSLLYVLAVTEPAYCYLAAVRQSSSTAHDEMVFNGCAILFPYFDDTGRFDCIVFENGREISLETFCGKYASCFIHLERVKTNDYFFPSDE